MYYLTEKLTTENLASNQVAYYTPLHIHTSLNQLYSNIQVVALRQ